MTNIGLRPSDDDIPIATIETFILNFDQDIYMALIGEGRCADAVRLIRKDNPFPVACAYICEHLCEARCRRNMIDDAINIRGLKRYAVDGDAGSYRRGILSETQF